MIGRIINYPCYTFINERKNVDMETNTELVFWQVALESYGDAPQHEEDPVSMLLLFDLIPYKQ